jgi:uncharacterized protein YidB (DUF937 family)
MGLLDQVLGQVIGGLGGGGQQPSTQGGGGFSQGGGFGQGGGGFGQGGAPQGGGLPGALGGMLSGKGGPIALAILALLASKHMKSGAGGYGSILHDMFTGQKGDGGLVQGSLPGGGGTLGPNEASPSGGFMNEVGNMLGGSGGGSQTGSGAGGMLTGGMLGSGLGELLERFTQNGHGATASSWIGTGPNQPVSPSDLESTLGSDTINDLSRETGLDRGNLLSQLSQALPQVVDKLTPNGRLPNETETSNWV